MAGPPSELDCLLNSLDDRVGAFGFALNVKPPAPSRDFNKTLDLVRLQEIADTVGRDEDIGKTAEREQVEEILLLHISMGGAQPKAVIEDASGLGLAKFNRDNDRWNQVLCMRAAVGNSMIDSADAEIISASGPPNA